MRQIFAALFLAIISLPVVAENVRYYDVEIVLFENLDPAARQSEAWESDVQPATPESFIELGLPFPGPLPEDYIPANTFKPLPDKALRLSKEVGFLKKSDRYRVLMHLGWRQPGMPADKSLAVHLERLVPPLETNILDAPANSLADNIEAVDAESMDSVPTTPANYKLDGFVRLSLSRYLHINTDLVYRQEAATDNWSQVLETDTEGATRIDSLPPTFHLLQARRMRSGELHYIDHPVLGMLILVSPIKKPKSAS